jgi:hypothetical protein
MVLNTTTGAVEVPRGTRSHINTTAVLEPPLMTYEDEAPEIIAVVPATGWQAVIGDEAVPLVAFVALDDASMHGVAVGSNGLINLTTGNVEELAGFTGYEQTNINDKKER